MRPDWTDWLPLPYNRRPALSKIKDHLLMKSVSFHCTQHGTASCFRAAWSRSVEFKRCGRTQNASKQRRRQNISKSCLQFANCGLPASFLCVSLCANITSLVEPAEFPRRRAPSKYSQNIAEWRSIPSQTRKQVSKEMPSKYLDIKYIKLPMACTDDISFELARCCIEGARTLKNPRLWARLFRNKTRFYRVGCGF